MRAMALAAGPRQTYKADAQDMYSCASYGARLEGRHIRQAEGRHIRQTYKADT